MVDVDGARFNQSLGFDFGQPLARDKIDCPGVVCSYGGPGVVGPDHAVAPVRGWG